MRPFKGMSKETGAALEYPSFIGDDAGKIRFHLWPWTPFPIVRQLDRVKGNDRHLRAQDTQASREVAFARTVRASHDQPLHVVIALPYLRRLVCTQPIGNYQLWLPLRRRGP